MNSALTLQLALSSLIVFLGICALIEFFIFALNVKNARFKVFLRLLPFIKLPIDLLTLTLNKSAFLNINPLGCSYKFQNMVGEMMNSSLLPYFSLLLSVFSAFFLFFKFSQLFYSYHSLKSLIAHAKICTRLVENTHLAKKLAKKKVKVYYSEDIAVPLATLQKYILIPLDLKLTQSEFETIIAHELEHLCWHDSFLKVILTLMKSIFWWIPMGWWMKRIYQDQELACDAAVVKYQLEKQTLAKAIHQVLIYGREPQLESAMLCHFVKSNSTIQMRIHTLLKNNINQFTALQLFAAALFIGAVSLNIWVC